MHDIIQQLECSYILREKPVGEFAKIKVKGMNFTIRQFYAVGLGNISVMQAVGFFGLMKMDTLIINPMEIDAPLFSYDRVHAMGNDTVILELYDTLLKEDKISYRGQAACFQAVKTRYKELPDHDLGSHWYDSIKLAESVSKKGKKKHRSAFDEMVQEYFNIYMGNVFVSDKIEPSDFAKREEKRRKAAVYVEGLLSNGGPSTDIFKEYYGEEKTAYLFRKILFGTQE